MKPSRLGRNRISGRIRIGTLIALGLSACVSADPGLVARAVEATLTAVVTPTPIVVVVTVIPTQPSAASPTPLAAPTETPAPTLTPTPSPAAAVGAVIFQDDFSQSGQWFLGDETEVQKAAIAGGKLDITLKVADRFALIFNTERRAGGFYAVVTATTATCQFRDRYGLLFRLQDDLNYYQFDLDCDGRFRLSKVMGGELTTLRDWTSHAAIRAGGGALNELGVRASGSSLEVFANGQTLFEASDNLYPEGGFGLYAGSGPQSATYTATFDDLRVWGLR
jgi:hypothetical protein